MSQSELPLAVKALTPAEYFRKRLAEHGHAIPASSPALERDLIRYTIVEFKFDCTIIGRAPNRKPETYAACFERLFNEPLTPKLIRRKDSSHVQTP